MSTWPVNFSMNPNPVLGLLAICRRFEGLVRVIDNQLQMVW